MKKLSIVILFLIFAGCTTTKINPAPIFEIQKGSRIGVINLVGKDMKHFGIKYDGTLSETENPITSDIPYYINNEIQRQAADLGYKVEILEVNEDIKRLLYNLTIKENNQIVLRPAMVPIFQQLSDDNNLSMLYIIKEAEGKFKIKNLYAAPRGYGMAIDLPGGIFSAFAILKAEAVYLDPVSLTRGAECLEKKVLKGHVISGKNEPTRKILPQYEITEGIKQIINKFISDLLKNSNLRG